MPTLNSTNIESADYNDERRVMTLTFKSGSEYEYVCPRNTYEALIASTSPGAFFHRHVKDVYQTIKVS